MPEGDTIHRIARNLRRDLPGRRVTRIELHDRGPVQELVGRRVEEIGARGKHLLIQVEGEWTVRLHLGMKGKVRRLAPGASPPKRPVLLLAAAPVDGPGPEVVVVCTRAYRAELIGGARLASHARLARLGPDLVEEAPDLDEVVRRCRRPGFADRELADLLLDQRVASGIGNVYKSELLFMHGLPPRIRAGAVDDRRLRDVFEDAARLLRLNLRTIRRTTVPTRRRPRPGSPRLWVYGRAGRPCLECGTKIRRFVQGDMARSTWYCPRCQGSAQIREAGGTG